MKQIQKYANASKGECDDDEDCSTRQNENKLYPIKVEIEILNQAAMNAGDVAYVLSRKVLKETLTRIPSRRAYASFLFFHIVLPSCQCLCPRRAFITIYSNWDRRRPGQMRSFSSQTVEPIVWPIEGEFIHMPNVFLGFLLEWNETEASFVCSKDWLFKLSFTVYASSATDRGKNQWQWRPRIMLNKVRVHIPHFSPYPSPRQYNTRMVSLAEWETGK